MDYLEMISHMENDNAPKRAKPIGVGTHHRPSVPKRQRYRPRRPDRAADLAQRRRLPRSRRASDRSAHPRSPQGDLGRRGHGADQRRPPARPGGGARPAGGGPVSVRDLMAALWGDDGDHEHRLQQQVSTLRKVLEPERERSAEPTVLVTVSPGYTLRRADVDVHAFSSAADHALGLAREERWQDALPALDASVAMWRGPALGDVRLTGWFDAHTVRGSRSGACRWSRARHRRAAGARS